MTERNFTYTWTDAKRLTVLHALGFMLARLETNHTHPAVSETILEIIGELSNAPGRDSRTVADVTSPTGTEAARAVLSPPAPMEWQRWSWFGGPDHFAADHKGNIPERPPEGAELTTVRVVAVQMKTSTTAGKASFMQVIANTGKANCFDRALWPYLEKREGKDVQLWLLRSGNYLNIVGVRA